MSEGTLAARESAVPTSLLRARSDGHLCKLAARGSEAAFTAIYERHYQALYRYCRTILGNEHDALDALQATMTSAFEALTGETREIALKPWLFRIAHNESISLVRKRRPEADLDSAAEVAAPEADPETRMRAQQLFADLDLLTDQQRASLVMREFTGLEFAEIGEALQTSAQGAKQSVYEARMALLDLERGRDMSCEEICGRISADDRRRRQSRVVRSHLKTCAGCRDFAAQLDSRREAFAAIAPPLATPVALSLLHGIIGGGGGGGGGAVIGGGGAAVGLGSGLAIKAAAVAIVAIGVGGVAIEATQSLGDPDRSRASEAAGGVAPAKAEDGVTTQISPTSIGRVRVDARRAAAASAGAKTSPDGGHRNGEAGSGSSNQPSAQATGGGNGHQASAGHGTPAGNAPAPAASDVASSGAPGNSEYAPGHGTTPPGQGGTPPGQVGTPPGQAQTPPGQIPTTPGPTQIPPGQVQTPPGQVQIPPGQVQVPPGQVQTPPENGPKP